MSNYKKLFDEFPPTSIKEWNEQISKDLKSSDALEKLNWSTIDRFKLKPFYNQEAIDQTLQTSPGEFPFKRGNNVEKNSWLVNHNYNTTDINNILKAIDNGVNSIGLSDNYKNIIDKIAEKDVSICNTKHKNSHEFFNLIKANKNLMGSVGYDAIGEFLITGEETEMNDLPEIIDTTVKKELNIKVVDINGNYFNSAGASIVQELAFSLSQAVEYISFLTDKGFKIDDIANKFQFKFSIGADYFLEIGKFRAAKYLWAKIIESYSPANTDACKMFIHAVSSSWNKTVYDPYVNLLRTTTESMSAIIGGIDVLTINPFDQAYNDYNDFSARVAKNQQLVLKEEAYLDKVIDPAEGSYYIERITDLLIKEAWKLFLEIEEHGGFINSFKKNYIQNLIKSTAWRRDEDIANGKRVFLGTNKYPNQQEKLKNKPKAVKTSKKTNSKVETLKLYRATDEFENLRICTEKTALTPKVFLFTYGDVKMRKARAGFASNFFACAGYDIIDNTCFDNIDDGIKEALKAKANIVVLCSSDDEYQQMVPTVSNNLKGKAELVIAGYPKEYIEQYKEMGIGEFIHVRSNILETLKNFNKKLGIK